MKSFGIKRVLDDIEQFVRSLLGFSHTVSV